MSTGTQELLRYNLASPQSEKNALPNTIPSADTIAPVHRLTFVSGVVAINTITPPMPGYHSLLFIFTAAVPVAFGVAGNVQRAAVPTQNLPIELHYDPNTAKYYPGPVS